MFFYLCTVLLISEKLEGVEAKIGNVLGIGNNYFGELTLKQVRKMADLHQQEINLPAIKQYP